MLLWQHIVGLSQTTVGRKYISKVFVKTLKDSGLYLHLQSALKSRAPPHCMTHCMLAFSALLVCILPPCLLPCHCGNLRNDGGHVVWRFDQSASFRIFDSTFYFPHSAIPHFTHYLLEHHIDEKLCVYGATCLTSRLLNCAEESAATTDWGKEFQSFAVLMLNDCRYGSVDDLTVTSFCWLASMPRVGLEDNCRSTEAGGTATWSFKILYMIRPGSIRPTSAPSAVVPPQVLGRSAPTELALCLFMLCICYIALCYLVIVQMLVKT